MLLLKKIGENLHKQFRVVENTIQVTKLGKKTKRQSERRATEKKEKKMHQMKLPKRGNLKKCKNLNKHKKIGNERPKKNS